MTPRQQAALSGDDPAAAPAAAPATRNVLVVGVGGQGVLMVSKVLARICQQHGFQVKQSEVHGMAKRGGVVFSHVRYGERVYSPTIPQGEADVLLAMEWAEGLRWLPFLNPEQGAFIADTQQIVPPFACRDRRYGAPMGYARSTVAQVLERVPDSMAMDATRIARELGNEKVANTVLLGALSTALEFPVDEWQETIERIVPPKTREANRLAFERGRSWALGDDRDRADLAARAPVGEPVAAPRVELDINAAWCKGCDICVKVCPERCLGLDASQVAVMLRPDACTGCHLCEWLCPDFAIEVRLAVEA